MSRDFGDDGDPPHPLPGYPTASHVIPEWRVFDDVGSSSQAITEPTPPGPPS